MTDTDAERRDYWMALAMEMRQIIAELRAMLAIGVVRGFTAEELESVRGLMDRSGKV